MFGERARLASHDGYQDQILPTGFTAGTPEEALDCAAGHYLNTTRHPTNLQTWPTKGDAKPRSSVSSPQPGTPGHVSVDQEDEEGASVTDAPFAQTELASADSAPIRPGRPKDVEIESRVYDKVLEVYAEKGWASFTIQAVATRSRVGKAAIYKRWSSKEELIAQTLMQKHGPPKPIPDTGTIRGDLIKTAHNELDAYLRPDGLVLLRAQLEAKIYPELFGGAMERWRIHRLDSGRHIVGRAIERGELPADVDGVLLLDAVGGMVMNHFIATPAGRSDNLANEAEVLAERIADFVLAAVGCAPRCNWPSADRPRRARGKSPTDMCR